MTTDHFRNRQLVGMSLANVRKLSNSILLKVIWSLSKS